MRRLFVFLCLFVSLSGFTQELSRDELAGFKTEAIDLISFLEFNLNAIGANELSAKEKDIIISESFLKLFRDSKVQIEDDLDDSRETVTNKDVQAYLKDVDFFFKYAEFTFNVLSIDIQIDENGHPFLLANILRSLQANTISGDSLKNDQQRFIEISVDSDTRELKIASIYTTKLNKNEENIAWWNQLPNAWKKVLGTRAVVSDSIAFSSIQNLNESFMVMDYAFSIINNTDTIWFGENNKKQKELVLKALVQIMEINDLNISWNTDIFDLAPLSKLSKLRTLNISHTEIIDLAPVLNLTKLHSLNCSNTSVAAVDALMYSMELAILNLSNTPIKSIASLTNLGSLIILDLSNTEIESLEACEAMPRLEDLKIRNTLITDLSPLQKLSTLSFLDLSNNEQILSLDALQDLTNLKVLYCSNTGIRDLFPLSRMEALETLYCENSEITSLSGVESLPNLKKIYCDNSLLGRKKAIDFMKLHPKILVVYESKQLQLWWEELAEEWKAVFAKKVEIDLVPTKEQLHEITTISELDISSNLLITSLLPLDKLKNIQKLNVSNTGIKSLDGLAESREMRELDFSNTKVKHLTAIENLNLIEELSFSSCPVVDLYPLKGMVNLKKLTLDHSSVENLEALENLQNLRFVNADYTATSSKDLNAFIERFNDVQLIFQSEALENWWKGLSDSWRSIFRNKMNWSDNPTTIELHKLSQIHELVITENRSITNLDALKMLKHLRSLKVNDTKITDINPLINLSYLTEVDLSRNPVSNLSPLGSLKNLNYIILNNTPIKDLEWIIGLTSIKTLDISSTEIKSIKELVPLIHLEKLIAYNTKINNIKPLDELFNLSLLKIYNSKVSVKKVEAFKSKNPKCEVDFY